MANSLQSETEAKGHVKFTEDTFDIGHDSDIGLRQTGPDLIDVHLGFLQIRHRYEITFHFESNQMDGSLVVRNPEDSLCPNLNVHVIDLRPDSTAADQHSANSPKYKICVELFAHREKLLKEQIHLHSSENPSQTLTLVFHARVLGKGKGTPFLKTGIKCIGQEMDEDDDDNSDWPGFN